MSEISEIITSIFRRVTHNQQIFPKRVSWGRNSAGFGSCSWFESRSETPTTLFDFILLFLLLCRSRVWRRQPTTLIIRDHHTISPRSIPRIIITIHHQPTKSSYTYLQSSYKGCW